MSFDPVGALISSRVISWSHNKVYPNSSILQHILFPTRLSLMTLIKQNEEVFLPTSHSTQVALDVSP